MVYKAEKFNDGVVMIYSVKNTAANGDMPKKQLEFKASLRYRNKVIGFNRAHVESQNNIKVDHLIRCPYLKVVLALDVAVINGMQYRIARIQYPDDQKQKVMELTLERLGDFYDVE